MVPESHPFRLMCWLIRGRSSFSFCCRSWLPCFVGHISDFCNFPSIGVYIEIFDGLLIDCCTAKHWNHNAATGGCKSQGIWIRRFDRCSTGVYVNRGLMLDMFKIMLTYIVDTCLSYVFQSVHSIFIFYGVYSKSRFVVTADGVLRRNLSYLDFEMHFGRRLIS